MSIVSHASLSVHEVPRIKTRVLAGQASDARQTTVWEQWIEPQGYIPPHYHRQEEVLVFLAGQVELRLDEATTVVLAPATVVVPAGMVHSVRPHAGGSIHLLAIFPTATPEILAVDGSLRPMPWEDVDTEPD